MRLPCTVLDASKRPMVPEPAGLSPAGKGTEISAYPLTGMDPSFSSRVPGRITRNQLSQAHARLSAAGASIIDLTESNPTRVGFEYPSAAYPGARLARCARLSSGATRYCLRESGGRLVSSSA